MAETHADHGPDLSIGTPIARLADGAMVSGHIGDDEVVLARSGHEYFAVGARCTHYKGRLARGPTPPFSYVGHADQWDGVTIDGSPTEKNCRVTYSLAGKTLAVATIGRQRESLVAETELERIE